MIQYDLALPARKPTVKPFVIDYICKQKLKFAMKCKVWDYEDWESVIAVRRILFRVFNDKKICETPLSCQSFICNARSVKVKTTYK